MKKINMKSNSGFTMTDLVIALTIFVIFTGVIGSLLYSTFRMTLQAKMSSSEIKFAVQILEDIDRIPYEQVKNGMEANYISKFSIPSGYKLLIEVSNYNEGNYKEDLIKVIKLTMSYDISGTTDSLVIQRLKIKET